MKIRKNKGFTIVELVIVIGVIGILSAILIPTFVSLTANAQKAREQSDVSNIYSMYAAEAADGWIDVESGDPTIEIELVGQDEVLITKVSSESTKYYVHDGKSWVSSTTKPADPTDKTWTYVAGTLENSKFNAISTSEYYSVEYAKAN